MARTRKLTDLFIASGAVHDEYGEVASVVPQTDRGREWLVTAAKADLSGTGGALYLEDEIECVIAAARSAGLTVKHVPA